MSQLGVSRKLLYVCLQSMREGQASSTHVNGIIGGLRSLGWSVELIEPGFRDEPGAVRRLLRLMWIQLRSIRHVKEAHSVYVRWHFATFPTVLVAKALGRSVSIEVNGTDQDFMTAWPSVRRVSWLIRGAARWQLRRADAIIAVTAELGEWAATISGCHHIAIVPNAADTEVFTPVRGIHPQGMPARYVVFVGALAPWQGVDIMLEAVHEAAWPADVTLVIAGDGARRDVCERANDGTSVRYMGRLPHAEIPGLLAGAIASISVQTPTSDRGDMGCSPIKVYEGLAVGRPIVTSDLPGMREIVEREVCGIVIPPGDAVQLAKAVARLCSDPKLADEMGRRGREAVVRQHSWTARAAATESFIEGVLTS
jgi:glycosyltransferase involved in cell wall biosynthesis